MASDYTPPKKVRLACRRCRTRRIKCDGQSPACTNCAKAGQACLDVDSQNSSITIPRNFAGAARARIEWLEDIVRTRLPDVDLDSGPHIDAYPETSTYQARGAGDVSPQNSAAGRRASLKRPADSHTDPSDLESEGATSIATTLGMLSLNSDSAQKHYLGSSSGLLFTNLIRASPTGDGRPLTGILPTSSSQTSIGHWENEWMLQDALRDRYQSLLSVLRQELPPRRDAAVLVQTYIRSIHMDYPVLELGSIYSAMDALYACTTLPSDPEDMLPGGWPSTVPPFRWNGREVNPRKADGSIVPMPAIAYIMFMIFNVAAIVKIRSRVYEYPPDKFYRVAKLFSNDCFAQISITSIQALVLLIEQCMLTPGEASLWTLVHVALMHCIELGTHREPLVVEPGDAAHQQVRRFLFYTVCGLGRSISSIQGRPLSLPNEDIDVQLPNPRTIDPASVGPIPPAFSDAITRFSTYYFDLDRIISDIKMRFYRLPQCIGDADWFVWSTDDKPYQEKFEKALDSWHDAASRDPFDFAGLDDQQRRIWRVKLNVRYHKTMTLLHQPSQAIRNPSQESLVKCFNSASSMLREYQDLNDLGGFQQGWRAVHNIFAAGATIVYSFWTSETVRRTASIENLSRSLRICSNLLVLGGEWWPSVKNGLGNFGAVADLTIRKLHMDGAPSKMPRLSHGSVARQAPQDLLPPDFVTAQQLLGISQGLDPGTSSVSVGADGQQQQQQQQVATDGSQAPWTADLYAGAPDLGASVIDGGLDPEIGSFLANFDNADFTWSISLDSFGQQNDL